MKRRLDVQRHTLQDKGIQEALLQNDFLKEQCLAYESLLKQNGISTHKLSWGNKQELPKRARRLNHKSRKKYITVAAPKTVLYAWFKKEVNKVYDSSAVKPKKKEIGRPPIRSEFK